MNELAQELAEQQPEVITTPEDKQRMEELIPGSTEPPEPEPEQAPEEDIQDVLQPRQEPVERMLGVSGENRQQLRFFQKPMSFMARMEFFGLLGETVQLLLDSEEGVTLDSLLSSLDIQPGQSIESDMQAANVMMKAFVRLSKVTPDFLDKCFVIWLDVPPQQRELALRMMRRPVDEGGFSDEQGWDIIEVFIEQNVVEIMDFFNVRLPKLMDKIRRLREFAQTRSSKRSRRSQPPETSP